MNGSDSQTPSRVVAFVGDVDVGSHPDREHDGVELRLELRQPSCVDACAQVELGRRGPSSSRASSGSGSFDWRYGAIP